jgi:hypothetical protein
MWAVMRVRKRRPARLSLFFLLMPQVFNARWRCGAVVPPGCGGRDHSDAVFHTVMLREHRDTYQRHHRRRYSGCACACVGADEAVLV